MANEDRISELRAGLSDQDAYMVTHGSLNGALSGALATATVLGRDDVSTEAKWLVVAELLKGEGQWSQRLFSQEHQAAFGTAIADAHDAGVIDDTDLVNLAMRARLMPGAQVSAVLDRSDPRHDGLVASFASATREHAQALRDGTAELPAYVEDSPEFMARFLEQSALIAQASTPSLAERHFSSPEAASSAFMTLLDYNMVYPAGQDNSNHPAILPTGGWDQHEGLRATTRIFAAHPDMVMDVMTARNGGAPQTEHLAEFLARTMFDPDAANVKMDDGRSVTDTVTQAYQSQLDRYMQMAMDTDLPLSERNDAARVLGASLTAVGVGTSHALQEFDDTLREHQEARDQFVKTLSLLLPVPPVAGGRLAKDVVLGEMFDALHESPDGERPDTSLINEIYDRYYGQLNDQAHAPGLTEQERLAAQAVANTLKTEFGAEDSIVRQLDRLGDRAEVLPQTTPLTSPDDARFAEAGPAGDDLLKSIESLQLAATDGTDEALLQALAAQGQSAQPWLATAQQAAGPDAVEKSAEDTSLQAGDQTQVQEAASRVA
ncbi:hypothetical protein [Hydrogenophaga sp. 5NK40-0174]|uniref:hypothetical protein n=1 Tax=Hydrogenophaga sp. 5NK40-0174 TaxID=3127649 RepID=UPI003106D4F0